MKSKAEILDIIYHCINRGQCPDCPLFSDEDCTIHIFSALNTLLNKSDFEVMKEILERSEEYHNDYSYEIQGNDYPTIILHRDTQMLWVDFDNKGDIL